MPLYFAYGANMDIAAMAKRAPASKPLGPARLARHRFIITKDGYASVVTDPRARVHGLLWDLALADVGPLDRFEEIGSGLYAKINQPVITPDGARRALIYVATTTELGRPKPGYLEAILVAAEANGLPATYRQEIAGWGDGRVGQGAGLPSASTRSGGLGPRATKR